jgi:uncharacterized membrane-anchored protein YhcB (DUF1043 family)
VEESNIIIAIISLGIGSAIGFFAGRSSSTVNNSQKRQVDGLKTEINQYKDSVATHFQQTATMVNDMNDSYKSVVQHLAKGSQDLCEAAVAKDIESRLIPQLDETKDISQDTADNQQVQKTTAFEPPRDYAPKKPDEVGALSENYGIQAATAEKEAQQEEILTPPLDAAPKQ